jgi:serine/threonine protein kinase
LLNGELPDEQQADLCTHLENCSICQQRLESLAAGKETWTDAARNLNAGQKAPEIGLQRILNETTESPGAEEGGQEPLDFLSPPADPSHLGKLGEYEVIEVISRGGMSIVLKAFDAGLHRMVAIKVLAPQLAATAAARTRFHREGRAAAAISHDHVAGVFEIGEAHGLPYLVREYISGESLQERLDRQGPMELKEILRIGMQMAQGLAAAHAQGLVHRDIKPANIMLHNGVARVKIIDFGLARTLDDASLTQSGVITGTPQYMSPEQARGDAIDARTDLFSLGSVLYAMCTGRSPFRASTTMGVLKRVSEESPRAVREVNADVPAWLVEIINKLHAKNPAERYQSATEVAELLGRHLADMQQGALTSPALVSPASLSVPSSHSSDRSSKRPWAIAAAFLPVIAGLLVVSEATGVTNVTEFMATVLRIHTSEGTLVVETDDPGIEVAVDGREIKILGAGPKEIRVKAGEHRIRAIKDGKEVTVEMPLVTVTRGGKTIVRIREENAQGQANASKKGRAGSDAGNESLDAEKLRMLEPRFSRLIDQEKPSRLGPQAPSRLDQLAGDGGTHEISVIRGHEGVVRSLVFTRDGKGLISAGGGVDGPTTDPVSGELNLWNVVAMLNSGSNASSSSKGGAKRPAEANFLWTVASPSPIFSAAFSPGGMNLATAEADGTVRLREADTGKVETIFRDHKGPVYTVSYAPDGQTIASAGLDRKVRIWRVGTRELLESFDIGNTKLVNCLAFSKDGKTLAVGGEDHYEPGPQAIADADGNILNKKRRTHSVRLFTVGSWKVRAVLAGHEGAVEQLAFSPNGKFLATAGEDGTVKLWNVEDGKEVVTLRVPGHASKVRCLAYSWDGSLLAVGGEKEITLWSIATYKLLSAVDSKGTVFSIAFSPDRRTLAFGGADRTIRLWSIGTSSR